MLYQGGTQSNPNHYSGDDSPANYGYIKINSQWVDPDSEHAIWEAQYCSSKANPWPTGRSSTGPYILSELEEASEYAEFADYVSDEEGDPRQKRITPELFAEWAVGAVRCGQYQATVIPIITRDLSANKKHSREDRSGQRSNKAMRYEQPRTPRAQFDIHTGEELSPAYSTDNHSISSSFKGVDLDKLPGPFARSYPRAMQTFQRAIRFEEVQSSLPLFQSHHLPYPPSPNPDSSCTSSTSIEDFTIQGFVAAFSPPHDPAGLNLSDMARQRVAERRYLELNSHIAALNQECRVALDEMHTAAASNQEIAVQMTQLQREIFLLKAHINAEEELAEKKREELAQQQRENEEERLREEQRLEDMRAAPKDGFKMREGNRVMGEGARQKYLEQMQWSMETLAMNRDQVRRSRRVYDVNSQLMLDMNENLRKERKELIGRLEELIESREEC
jgi:hypothetical protein